MALIIHCIILLCSVNITLLLLLEDDVIDHLIELTSGLNVEYACYF